MKYNRILLKLSGEALMGEMKGGIDPDVVQMVAEQVKAIRELNVDVGLVIGGGNIFRGVAGATKGMEHGLGTKKLLSAYNCPAKKRAARRPPF